MNYFSLFGLPTHFEIDIQALTSCFRNLQQRHHPDKFASSSQAEQLAAVEKSAIINQAWQTLYNPLSRAKYLLSLHGFDIINEKYTEYNTTFLMELFSLREEFDKIKRTQNIIQLKTFTLRVTEIFDLYYQQMVKELSNEKWENAANILCKLHFITELRNLVERFKEKLLNL